MNTEELKFLGIHSVEPENHLCALFYWEEADRHVPIWISPIDGVRVLQVLEHHFNARPSTYELLIEFAEKLDGIESISVDQHNKGAFMVEIIDGMGNDFDARITDAIVLADHFDLPITFNKDLLADVAVYIGDDDLKEYFGLERDAAKVRQDGGESDVRVDDGFEQMMRDSGFTEEDFLSGDDEDGTGN